jgi:hypothetical protein
MRVQAPNSSLFPEIDFAAKCIDLNTPNRPSQSGNLRATTTIARLLYSISNATSSDVQKRIAASRFYVGVMGGKPLEDGVDHVAISLEDGMEKLIKGHKYF